MAPSSEWEIYKIRAICGKPAMVAIPSIFIGNFNHAGREFSDGPRVKSK
jgi:hypothetical protein